MKHESKRSNPEAGGRALDPAESAFFSDLQNILLKDKRQASLKTIARICGVDAAYHGDHVFATACLFEKGRLVASAGYQGRCSLPYVSGLFYIHEGPFVVEAVRSLEIRPQLVCFDAHGAAHPRAAGLATVCGMILGIQSVGIAKSLLVGGEVRPQTGGGLGKIVYGHETVGFVTTISGAKRFWSPGYSTRLARLRSIIKKQALACLRAVEEADRTSKQARSSFLRSAEEWRGQLRGPR